MLRKAFASGELKAMGEIAAQCHGLDPSDEWFEPHLALAEELDIPVGKFSVALGNPRRLEPLLTIMLAVEGVDSAAFLTPGQKRAIFHDNATRFLKLLATAGQ